MNKLTILYEDGDVIAFVKPPQMLSQRAESGEASVLEHLAAYADGADFDYVISRLAPIGEKMAILLA